MRINRSQMFRVFSLVVFLFLVNSCQLDTSIAASDANSQIYAAALFKSRECGGGIPQITIAVNKVAQRNLALCTIAILRTSCPFSSFPAICLSIYDKKPLGSIPPFFDFQWIQNQKL